MKRITSLFCLLGLMIANSNALATNLIANGDFEAGNSGFSSDYTFIPGPNSGAAQYTVGTNPNAWNGAFPAIGDNTSGTGQMLIVNASTDTSQSFWAQDLAVEAGQQVDIELYATSLFNAAPPNIVVEIDGLAIDNFSLASTTVGEWNFYSTTFVPMTTGTVELTLRDSIGAAGGDDFAIDDILVTSIPEPTAGCLIGLAAILGGFTRRGRQRPS